MIKTQYYRGIEIEIPAGVTAGAKLPFPLQKNQQVNNKLLSGVETFTDAILSFTPTSQLTTITQAQGAAITVVLVEKSADQKIYNIPYNALNTSLQSGIIRELQGVELDIQASYLLVNNTAVFGAGGQGAFIGLMYEDLS